jgi:hypothetical protein
MDTSKLSVEEVLALGELKMKEDKPQEAELILINLYSRLESRPISLLDSLVSVSLRLDRESSAMRYATEMIKVYPRSALV